MSNNHLLNRRESLAAAVTGASLVLSGCSQFGGSSETPTPSGGKTTATETSTTATESATPTLPNDGESWPMFGYDAANTRFSPQAEGSTDRPEIVWNPDFERGLSGLIRIYDDTIYVVKILSMVADSDESKVALTSVDVDGSVRWQLEYDGQFQGLAVTPDGVYAGHENNTLYAFENDGTTRWQTDIGSTPYITPADGRLYSSKPTEGMMALTQGGETVWEYTVDTEHWMHPILALKQNSLYLGGSKLYSLSTDGTKQWTYEPENDRIEDVVAGEDAIYASVRKQTSIMEERANSHHIVALSQTGERRWKANHPGLQMGSLAEDTFLVPRNDGLVGLDPETGHEQWIYECNPVSPATVGGDTAYIQSSHDTVHAVDVHTGEQLWQYEFEHDIYSTQPVVVGGRVYVTVRRKGLLALR